MFSYLLPNNYNDFIAIRQDYFQKIVYNYNMKRTPIVIILNNIRSALNVGAIIRTADAVLAEKVYLTGYTATPEHPKVPKTSLGAENSVPWEKRENVLELLTELKNNGYSIVGLEIHPTSENFWETSYKYPVALLLGNEIDGIYPELIERCDKIVHIPMLGQKESLNVATATGIAAFEIAKKHLLEKEKSHDRK